MPTAAAPAAATGRSLPLRSTKRAAPQIAIEKMIVMPMPATADAAIVCSSSLVWTTVASIRRPLPSHRHRRAVARASDEGDRDQGQGDDGDEDWAGGAGAEGLGDAVGGGADRGRR